MSAPEKDASQRELLWRMWHREPMTQKFFHALRKRAESWAFAAARKAGNTKAGNNAEHNNLIRVNEILKLIEDYGNPDSTPDSIE